LSLYLTNISMRIVFHFRYIKCLYIMQILYLKCNLYSEKIMVVFTYEILKLLVFWWGNVALINYLHSKLDSISIILNEINTK